MDAKPFGFDSIEKALDVVIAHLGGYKAVACVLWPALDADRAGKRLADQLNVDRGEKPDLSDVIAILRMARKRGCDTAAAYLMRVIGYADPQPIDPVIEAQRVEADLLSKMDGLQGEFSYLRSLKADANDEPAPGRNRSRK